MKKRGKKRIGVIGFGRFGKLWVQNLASLYSVLVYDIQGVDLRSLTVEARKYAQVCSLDSVLIADVVFLLVPIGELESCCKEIRDMLSVTTTVVDACSVKVKPVSVMKRVLKRTQPIVATHPLFGPDSVARLGLAGRRVAVSRVRASDSEFEKVTDILDSLKLNIIETTPEEHDRQMAHSQALVHFIGRGLEGLDLHDQKISTPDYETLLRMKELVSNDTWELFIDMQQYNPFAEKVRNVFIRELGKVEEKIKYQNAKIKIKE